MAGDSEVRIVTTHTSPGGLWFYKVHDGDDEPYESAPIFRSRSAAHRAGLKDVEMCDLFEKGEAF